MGCKKGKTLFNLFYLCFIIRTGMSEIIRERESCDKMMSSVFSLAVLHSLFHTLRAAAPRSGFRCVGGGGWGGGFIVPNGVLFRCVSTLTEGVCVSVPLLANRLRMLRSDICRRAAMGGTRESVAGSRVTSAFMSLSSSSNWFNTARMKMGCATVQLANKTSTL